MKKIICKKPCRFGGKDFFIGDEIPVNLVDPSREATLIKYGYISCEIAPEPASDKTPTNTSDDTDKGQPEPINGKNDDVPSDTSTESKNSGEGKKKNGKKAEQ